MGEDCGFHLPQIAPKARRLSSATRTHQWHGTSCSRARGQVRLVSTAGRRNEVGVPLTTE
eukprot:9098655-Pyramimonas_sp.AAC.3